MVITTEKDVSSKEAIHYQNQIQPILKPIATNVMEKKNKKVKCV